MSTAFPEVSITDLEQLASEHHQRTEAVYQTAKRFLEVDALNPLNRSAWLTSLDEFAKALDAVGIVATIREEMTSNRLASLPDYVQENSEEFLSLFFSVESRGTYFDKTAKLASSVVDEESLTQRLLTNHLIELVQSRGYAADLDRLDEIASRAGLTTEELLNRIKGDPARSRRAIECSDRLKHLATFGWCFALENRRREEVRAEDEQIRNLQECQEAIAKDLREHQAEMLRRNAPEDTSTPAPKAGSTTPPADDEQEAEPGATKRPRKNVNARLFAAIQQDPERIHWSADRFAKFLGCGKSVIVDSPTWKNLIMAGRAMHTVERINQREGEKSGRGKRRNGKQLHSDRPE